MDRTLYNNLLLRFDYDATAREELFRYMGGNIKRYLVSKYGDLPDINDIVHNILMYFVEHRPKDCVYAPYKYTIKCAKNYIASHREIFNKYVPLDRIKEVQYEQQFIGLDKADILNQLKVTLKNELAASLFYRHYIDGDSEKDLANEFGLSYVNVRAIISRARKNFKKYLTECNRN